MTHVRRRAAVCDASVNVVSIYMQMAAALTSYRPTNCVRDTVIEVQLVFEGEQPSLEPSQRWSETQPLDRPYSASDDSLLTIFSWYSGLHPVDHPAMMLVLSALRLESN